jgi:hypothetical protein
MRVRKWLLGIFTLHFILFAALWPSADALAEEDIAADIPEDIRELLNKGLTIYEIDQELMRLDETESKLIVEIEAVSEQAAQQEKVVEAKRVHAGKVLRSYYKGKRSNLWLFIFHADSFYEAIQTYYYLSQIYKQDRRILKEHADSYRRLMELIAKLEQDRAMLQRVRNEFIAQRNRLVALQEELDRELAERDDRDAVQEAIDALTRVWETKGLPLFKHYLNQMSKAISKLPDEIIANGNMRLRNGRFVLSISDTELTKFFRDFDPVDFEQFTLSFAENDFTVYGTRDDTSMNIKGYYEVDTDQNILVFHMTKLVYNGFELPDTTIRALTEEVDLNFHPDLLDMPFKVKAQEVAIENRELIISFVLRR